MIGTSCSSFQVKGKSMNILPKKSFQTHLANFYLRVGFALLVSLFLSEKSARGEPLGPDFLDTGSRGEQIQFFEKFGKLKDILRQAPDEQSFIFDPSDLHRIVRKYTDQPLDQAFTFIHQELMARYPGKILDQYRFIFNDAGAALGQVAILYASPNEYLIFFGSPISTGGFSGRYKYADFYDFMIAGEMTTVVEGQTVKQTYRPGDMAYLPRGTAKGYQLNGHGWMLEYSRGNMISSFGFGVIGPAMFITMDWEGALAQVSDFIKGVMKSSGFGS
jgi:hypothetical protein